MTDTPGHDQFDQFDEIAEEFTERQRGGEGPSVEEYARRYPEHAEDIRELFPTIAAVETMKGHSDPSPPASLSNEQPDTLGDFHIVRELGRGGMGIVFEARQESLDRHVALKVLPPYVLTSPKALVRFHREARTAAGLHHTNIVPVYGIWENEGLHYYVMQLIHGVGLDRVVERFREDGATSFDLSRVVSELLTDASVNPAAPTETLEEEPRAPEPPAPRSPTNGSTTHGPPTDGRDTRDWKSVAAIGLQAADALSYAHRQGVLHRDIKPANLLLDQHGTVWITDFGLASAADQSDLSLTGDIVGTVRYMSPERFRGEADPRSDVYSLGLTLWECLTLRIPFQTSGRTSLIQSVQDGRLPHPRNLDPRIPIDLATIVAKATACEPSDRYASASDLAEDLRSFLDGRPISARRVAPHERLWRWCRRNPAVAGLTVLAFSLLVAVGSIATIGYVRVERANSQVGRALEDATRQKENAQDVLDTIFQRLAPPAGIFEARSPLVDETSDPVDATSAPVLSNETATLLEDLLQHYDQLSVTGTGDDPVTRGKAADARLRVAQIRFRLGQYEDAVRAFELAFEAHQAAGAPPVRLSAIENEIGLVYHTMDRKRDSRESHSRALARLEALPDDARQQPVVRFQMARTHYLLALRLHPGTGWSRPEPPGERRPPRRSRPQGIVRPHRSKSRSEEVHEHIGKSSRLLEDLIAETPGNTSFRRLLALCYLQTARGPREAPESAKRNQEAIAILEELAAADPHAVTYRNDLVDAYGGLHPRTLSTAQLPQARVRLEKALEHAEELVREHPNEPRYISALVHVRMKLADVLTRSGQGDADALSAEKITEHYRRAATLQTTLVERFPEVGVYSLWLSRVRGALARHLVATGALESAKTVVTRSIDQLEDFLASDPGHAFVHGSLGESYRRLAEIHGTLGHNELAQKATAAARGHRRAMHEYERSQGGPADRPGGAPPRARRRSTP